MNEVALPVSSADGSTLIAAAAKMPDRLTCEPAPNATPNGFSTKTLPLPLMIPSICEGVLIPVTKFHQVTPEPS